MTDVTNIGSTSLRSSYVICGNVYADKLLKGCAGLGTIMSAGASAMLGGTAVGGASIASLGAAVGAAAIGGAVGSIASQGMAIGTQDSFNWKGVALSSLSAGAASSLGGAMTLESQVGNAMVRGALTNAGTQGVAVVTGLQSSFNWRGVAASAAGAGAVTAIARGGRVAVQQVATDAFGNALGQGLAQAMGQSAVTAGGGDSLDALLALNDNFSGADVSRAGSGLGGQLGGSGLGVMPSNSTLNDWSQGIDHGVTQAAAVTTASSTGTGAYGGPAVGSSLDDAEIASMRSENFSRINALAAQSATEMGVSSGVASSGFDAQGRYVVEIYGYEKTGSMAGSVQLDPVQDFQSINDQKVAAGTYDRFSEIGNAMTDGRYGDAWSHLSFSASEQARTTATQRLYPQPSAEAQRLSAMMASPAGAVAWGAAGLAGASADTQDAILQTVAAVGQVAGAATGVYKQTLTAQAPSPMTAAARSRGQGATPLASSTGSRPDDFLVANHGDMPTPRPGQNSHHGVMSKWMEANYPGYKPDLAPAVLLPVENHRATYGVYNRWRAETSRQMGVFDWAKVPESSMRILSNQMFDAAKVPDASRQQYWNRYEAMKGALEK